MKTTVIYAHPYGKSFCHAILVSTLAALNDNKRPANVIDLYADNFDPVMRAEDLALFRTGGFNDPLVGRYQGFLRESSRIVVIFPVWWGGAPAILKGFFDKVFLKGFAYRQKPGEKMTPSLANVEKVLFFTTSGMTAAEMTASETGRLLEWELFGQTFGTAGAKDYVWLDFGALPKEADTARAEHLAKVKEIVVREG